VASGSCAPTAGHVGPATRVPAHPDPAVLADPTGQEVAAQHDAPRHPPPTEPLAPAHAHRSPQTASPPRDRDRRRISPRRVCLRPDPPARHREDRATPQRDHPAARPTRPQHTGYQPRAPAQQQQHHFDHRWTYRPKEATPEDSTGPTGQTTQSEPRPAKRPTVQKPVPTNTSLQQKATTNRRPPPHKPGRRSRRQAPQAARPKASDTAGQPKATGHQPATTAPPNPQAVGSASDRPNHPPYPQPTSHPPPSHGAETAISVP